MLDKLAAIEARYEELGLQMASTHLATDYGALQALAREHAALEDTLRRALVPKDPFAEKDVIVEIRAAAGGEEASLFAGDLYRMYGRYAERRGWTGGGLDSHPS